MNRWKILPIGLLLSSLLAMAAQQTTSDLSKLELLTSIKAQGHAAGTLTNNDDFQTRGSLDLSPDGSRLASLDTTGTLKLWDARNGNELRTFTNIPGEIVKFKNYKTVMLKQPVYDPENNDPLKSPHLKLNLDTGQVSADPDFKQCQLKTNATKLVSTCSSDSRLFARFRKKQVNALNIVAVVDVIDLASGQIKYTIQNPEIHVETGIGLEFNPDGTAIAIQFETREKRVGIQVFDLKNGKNRSVFESGRARIIWLDAWMLFTEKTQPPGEFSSLDQDTTIRLWDSMRGQSIWTIEPREHASSPAPSADGKRFVVVREGSYPELRDVNSREVILRFGHSITDFAISPDGNSVLTASAAGKVRTWESKDGRERSRLPGRDGYISAMAISPDAQILAAAFEEDIQLWDISGKSRGVIKTTASLRSLEFSPDGNVLAGQDFSNSFQLWNVANRTPISFPEIGPGISLNYANSSSVVLREEERRRTLDSGQGPNFERRLSLIDVNSGISIWEGAWRPSGSQDWVFSPDGNLFARNLGSDTDTTVDVITTKTGKIQSKIKIGLQNGMIDYDALSLAAIAPDNRTLLVTQAGGDGCGGSFSNVRAFDLETGSDLKLPKKLSAGYGTFVGCGTGGEFPKFKFSAYGRYLAVKHSNSIDLWGARDQPVIFGNP